MPVLMRGLGYGVLWRISGIVAGHITRRSTLIERLIKVPMSEQECSAVKSACDATSMKLGHFYRWYLAKMIFARSLRKGGRKRILEAVAAIEGASESSELHHKEGEGFIVAVPHHGHYIAAIISLVERIKRTRRVLIMYGSPESHPGNEVFDDVCKALWSGPGSGVEQVNTGTADVLKCIRVLREGGVLFTLPDVYTNQRDAYVFRFLGRRADFMVGSAALARGGRATIFPVVPSTCMRSGKMKIRVLPPLKAETDPRDVYARLAMDYELTKSMVACLEQEMGRQILHWQYVRQVFQAPKGLPVLEPESVELVLSSLISYHKVMLGMHGLQAIDEESLPVEA